ncbi:integrase [Staphylococcus simulans]|uniref:tyrosine-type recombinase/integrase n=3 Tax=Staphylococcus simulans TaxID=1286 RepID=UPI000D0A34E1|nr:tyrosine-type recombinase/integrase [Staphylococcus simulans]AVO03199.1 integrase [Staphylococcus simulans]AVO06154.1 integrase [Staphylococcus simulans]AWG19747.1 integrase [Staphylococcus simulans]AWI02695.1 integrase [Staphylococcus simulans]PTJ07545.1 integrase [Staphylococcus simulans]
MLSFIIEKTLRNDGTQSVILVDSNYQIIEPVALFLEYLEKRGNALNTIESYCRGLKEYFTWLEREKMKFYEVTKRDMFSWIEYIELEAGRKQKKSARTINTYLATIGSFYDYFEGMEGYIANPMRSSQKQGNPYFQTFKVTQNQVGVNFFRQKETKKKNTKRLFQNEVELLYNEIKQLTSNESVNKRNKLIFKVLYETGCRISEVLGLRICDYSEPNPTEDLGTIYIRKHDPLYHKDHSIKTNERDIPVSMDLIYAIDDYLCTVRPQTGEVDTVFVNHSSSSIGKYMVRSSIEEIFINLSNSVGIKCTPHMLRHTHGTELKESGYSEVYIMDRLGHNSIESTNQYMHLSYEAQAEAYNRFLKKRR